MTDFVAALAELTARLPEGARADVRARPFFGGAALYAGGAICATLSHSGFALKLPLEQRAHLAASGAAKPHRFVPTGPVKREYVRIADDARLRDSQLPLLADAITYALGRPTREGIGPTT